MEGYSPCLWDHSVVVYLERISNIHHLGVIGGQPMCVELLVGSVCFTLCLRFEQKEAWQRKCKDSQSEDTDSSPVAYYQGRLHLLYALINCILSREVTMDSSQGCWKEQSELQEKVLCKLPKGSTKKTSSFFKQCSTTGLLKVCWQLRLTLR